MAHLRDLSKPIVLDNGSNSIKAGFAGDDVPFSVFDSVVGHIRHPEIANNFASDTFVGQEAVSKRGVLTRKCPIENGIITKWDEMEKIWDHTFKNELFVEPELHPVLLTETPFNPKLNREKMTEIIFELFDVPAIYVIIQSVASLYSSGHTAGIAVECGESVSHTVPVYEGYALPHAISRLDCGGRDIRDIMLRLILEQNIEPPITLRERRDWDDVMKKCGYVALDFEKELKLAKEDPSSVEAIYELPDGETFKIHSLRFCFPEIIFHPLAIGLETSGIHEKANDSIMKCDADIRRSLYKTIVLSGGTTMFPGFARRVSKEITALAPGNMKVKVIEPKDKITSAWLGGSILASLDTFQQMWISKSNYDEYGSSIVNWKCI